MCRGTRPTRDGTQAGEPPDLAPDSVPSMVLEHAVITIRDGTSEQFEAALRQARAVIAASPGFVSLSLHRGVEDPDRYLLLVEWETLDDHVVGFRESERFTQWRALIGPFFDSPPSVDHLVPVDGLS
jgi:heme-degrading monooxygenase HmoA